VAGVESLRIPDIKLLQIDMTSTFELTTNILDQSRSVEALRGATRLRNASAWTASGERAFLASLFNAKAFYPTHFS
jgi:hypothetical protein